MKNINRLAIAGSAFLMAIVAHLVSGDKAQAFYPACTLPNMENVGGDGAGPATVAQSLRLAEIRLTHPQASFCSMISDYNVDTYIQWPSPTKRELNARPKGVANLLGTTWNLPEDIWAFRSRDGATVNLAKGTPFYVTAISEWSIDTPFWEIDGLVGNTHYRIQYWERD